MILCLFVGMNTAKIHSKFKIPNENLTFYIVGKTMIAFVFLVLLLKKETAALEAFCW